MKKDKSKRKTSVTLSPAKGKAAKHEDFLTDLVNLARLEEMDRGKESLGGRIQRVRETLGLTIKDLSSRTGISPRCRPGRATVT